MIEDPDSEEIFPDNDDNPDHHHPHFDNIIVFNIMTRDLIKRPRNLWDAYGQSIILPLVANAQNEEKLLRIWQSYGHLFGPLKNANPDHPEDRKLIDAVQVLLDRVNAQPIRPRASARSPWRCCARNYRRRICEVDFEIPADHQAQTLEWKRSNLEFLFQLGVQTGEQFVNANQELVRRPAA